jgi:hypothetical protein
LPALCHLVASGESERLLPDTPASQEQSQKCNPCRWRQRIGS